MTYVKKGYAAVIAANKKRAGDAVAAEVNRQARLRWYAIPENKARMAPISRRNGQLGGRPLGRKDSRPRKVGKQVSPEARNS